MHGAVKFKGALIVIFYICGMKRKAWAIQAKKYINFKGISTYLSYSIINVEDQN